MPGKRVLVIDEDVESRRELRDRLSAADWQVDDAPGGLAALDKIQQARAYGEGYHCIIAETFLPDTDGILLLMALREMYPELPLIAVTAYGSDQQQEQVVALSPSVYFDKPVDMAGLLEALESMGQATTTAEPVPAPEPEPLEDNVCAYIMLRVASGDRVEELFNTLLQMPGVVSANAVRGDYDLILRVATTSSDKLEELIEEIGQVEGAKIAGSEKIMMPMLSSGREQFVRHFQTVWSRVNRDYRPGQETNAYLMIDIDRYQMERIYTSIKLTEGVYRCRVAGGGSKLMVLMSGAVRPGVVRHLLRKLAEMDGILRVREATVINLRD